MLDTIIGIFTAAFSLTAEMAPYLLFGLLAAGVLHVVLPKNWAARGLGGSGLKPVLRAALIGIPLPLCSCSVVPVTASIKKSGASDGATVSFLVTTPTSGVDSIFATYSLLGGVFAIARVISSFVIGLAAGAVCVFTGAQKKDLPPKKADVCATDPAAPPPRPTAGPGLIKKALVYAFSELLGGMAKSLALGLLLGGIISYFVPPQFLGKTVSSGFLSYLAMTALGIPLYVCASGSIPLAAALLAKGISPGAALVFLITGPATNAAVLAVISKMLGKRALAAFLGTLITGAVIAGVALDAFAGLFPGLMIDPVAQHAHDTGSAIETLCATVLLSMLFFHLARPLTAKVFFKKKGLNDMFKLLVPDMTCAHCAATITDAVSGLSGVKSVQADPATKTVAVDLEDTANTEAVIRAVQNAGYSPEKM